MRKIKFNLSAELLLRIIEAVIAVALIALLLNSILKIGNQSNAEGREHLENSVRRFTVACYADEGVYPPNVKYLEDHYGLQINKTKYTVRYEVFAENIMPEITVLEKNK